MLPFEHDETNRQILSSEATSGAFMVLPRNQHRCKKLYYIIAIHVIIIASFSRQVHDGAVELALAAMT